MSRPHVALSLEAPATDDVSLVDTVLADVPAVEPVSIRPARKDGGRKPVDAETSRSTLFSQRTQTLLGVQVVGSGSYVPDNVVTNADLADQIGADSAWIEKRSGIRERRHVVAGQATSDLACEAARRAFKNSGVDPSEVDLLVVGTFTPDFQCPSAACLVQDKLGLDVPAFDVSAACSGFLYALVTAAQYVATGNSQMALVIGADTNSRIVDPGDKKTFPLFGDGAGAVLIAKGDAHQGLLCYQMGSDGSGGPLLARPAGGSLRPNDVASLEAGDQYLQMDGRNVFKWAVRVVADTIGLVVGKSGLTVDDVGLFVLHQANERILNHAVESLGIPPEKVYNNLQRYGNTSGASVPLALDEALQEGRIVRGDVVCLCGFGAGLTWGTGLFRW